MSSRQIRGGIHRVRGSVGLVGAALAIAGAAVVMGGCYTRVVGARGPGADQYSISEPYQQDTKLDRWFYGSQPDRRNRSLPGLR